MSILEPLLFKDIMDSTWAGSYLSISTAVASLWNPLMEQRKLESLKRYWIMKSIQVTATVGYLIIITSFLIGWTLDGYLIRVVFIHCFHFFSTEGTEFFNVTINLVTIIGLLCFVFTKKKKPKDTDMCFPNNCETETKETNKIHCFCKK